MRSYRSLGLTVVVAVGGVALGVLCYSPLCCWLELGELGRTGRCAANLRELGAALGAYSLDNDGWLPAEPAEGDLFGRRWTARTKGGGTAPRYELALDQPGPLWRYTGTASLCRCPTDPACRDCTGVLARYPSYVWNHLIAGREHQSMCGEPLMWDRHAWHDGRRNLAILGPDRCLTIAVFAVDEDMIQAHLRGLALDPSNGEPLSGP